MAEIIRCHAVDEDLLNIWLHIARDNPGAADRQLDRIENRCRLYASHPDMGELRPDLGVNVRCFPVDNYVVIYRPGDDGILVLLITHGSRDIPAAFRERFSRYPT